MSQSAFLAAADKIVDRLASLSAIVSVAALVFGTSVILVDIIGRIFGMPLSGSSDLIESSFVLIVFGGLPLCDRNGGNVAVDLLENTFSLRANHLFLIFANVIGVVLFTLMSWQMWQATEISRLLNSTTNMLNIPKVPFQYAATAFCAFVALGMVMRIIQMIRLGPASRRTWARY